MSAVSTGGEAGVRVHETASVDADAELGPGVDVGPYAIVGPGVSIGAKTRIGPRVLIERDTTIGSDCWIANGAVLGTDPQDLKYRGEETHLDVGDRTVIREFATLNRGTAAAGRTRIGSDCLLMAYSHVAHDCDLGSHVIVSNAVNMGGHVVIEDWAIVGGLVAIHQFVRIGTHAFVGGGCALRQDVPPYCRVSGHPAPKLFGLNTVGLERRGFSPGVRRRLKRAYRRLFNTGQTVTQAIASAEADEAIRCREVAYLLQFIRDSERGISS